MSRRDNRKLHVEHEIRYARSLVRRETELYHVKRNNEVLIELPEPIRAGWERYWIINSAYTHTNETPLLRRLLSLVQVVEYSHRRDFARRDWKHGGEKTPTQHGLGRLSEDNYQEKVDKDLQPYFVMVYHRPDNEYYEKRYGVKPPVVVVYEVRQSHQHKFQSRTRPYYITHRVLPNSAAESELTEIKGKLYGGESWLYRHIIRHMGDWDFDYYYNLPPKRLPLVLPDEVMDLNLSQPPRWYDNEVR